MKMERGLLYTLCVTRHLNNYVYFFLHSNLIKNGSNNSAFFILFRFLLVRNVKLDPPLPILYVYTPEITWPTFWKEKIGQSQTLSHIYFKFYLKRLNIDFAQ